MQEFALCTDVQINGTLGIQRPLSYDFPAGSVVSSVLLYTDAFGRIGTVFDQKTWDVKINTPETMVVTTVASSGNISVMPLTVPRFVSSVTFVSQALKLASFAVEPKNVMTQSRTMTAVIASVAE